MPYFTINHHLAVLAIKNELLDPEAGLQTVYTKLTYLHQRVFRQIQLNKLNIEPLNSFPNVVSTISITTPFSTPTLSLQYMRPVEKAVIVERIMGREHSNNKDNLEPRLHPVIEIRLTPDHFVIELVVAPDAWYDQQNFVGKLSVDQHRLHFYELLASLGSDYYIGFWSGTHLSDMTLKTDRLPPARIMMEYVDTFAAGRDYLRVGRWYEPDCDDLTENNIVSEIIKHTRNLMDIYDFILWTSNNNFHSFYKKIHTWQ